MEQLNKTINSLAPGISLCDFKNVIFNLALLIGIFTSSYDNILRWNPQDLIDDKSTFVQVMDWCRREQAITWTSVDQDLQRNMASPGSNELNELNHCNLIQPFHWNLIELYSM